MGYAKFLVHSLLGLGVILTWALPAAAATEVDVAMVLWRGMTEAERGFQARLHEAEGYEFNYTTYDANQDKEQLAKIISQVESGNHALIYSFGTTVTRLLKERIRDRPIVFNIVARPIQAQLIDSWEHSGSNITGASNKVPMASAFTTLSKVMTIKRLGLIYNPKEPNSVIQRAELEQLGSQFGYRLVEGAIEDPEAIQEVVTSLIATQIDAVLLPSDSLVKASADIIIPLLNQHKIPSIASIPAMVRDNNAFIGIGPDYFELGRMAGDKALAILTGTLPNDVPSTRPDRMHMTVNLATAREIGINVPVQLLRLSTVIR